MNCTSYHYKVTGDYQQVSDETFDEVISTLKQLSPVQLRFLKEQIQDSLDESEEELLTVEELDTIAELFSARS
ncbi:hypothetical protein [Vibrio viridaestus]|uniref:Uncharacterized protein n=1 Tax=Vibrio viridaestus TaxID=2487322 RepID=A0A3N9TK67_9VIBR|nr:hypothetical protein [Vibrio viridaestus]RQW64778.1 hypothetical protein EES38_01655 [Vibrio viridaestus]